MKNKITIEHQFIFALLEDPGRFKKLRGISSNYLLNPVAKLLFRKLLNYHRRTKKFLDIEALGTYISSIPKKKLRKKFSEFYSELATLVEISESQFEYILEQIKKNYKKKLISNKVYDVLVANENEDNPDKAEKLWTLGLQELRRQSPEEAPLIDLDDELSTSLEEYEKMKNEDKKAVPTGIDLIDMYTGGLYPGELWLLGGYTSEGKTTVLTNIARNIVVNGYNVLFITLEETVKQMRWRFACCHSNYIKNGSAIPGVVYSKIETTALEPEELKKYKKTIKDWYKNKNRGRIFFWQAPANTMVITVEDIMNYLAMDIRLDAVLIDYAQLVRPTKRIGNTRYEMTEVIEDLKQLALTFNDGKGIPILTAWQISRKGRNNAEKRGYYIKEDFSETSFSERTSDVMLWFLTTDEFKEAGLIKYGIAKNRGGPTEIKGRFLKQNFATNYIGTKTLDQNEVDKILKNYQGEKKASEEFVVEDFEEEGFFDDIEEFEEV